MFTVISAIALLSLAVSASGQPPEPPADGHISPHQSPLYWLEPNSGRSHHINPPTFRWPLSGKDDYVVQVARSAGFDEIVAEHETSLTFWRPLEPMSPGEYFWRYRGSSWPAGAWSAVEHFVVSEDAVAWSLPPWEESIARVPDEHPRLWLTDETLADLRRMAAGRYAPILETWRGRFDSEIGRELPLEDEKIPKDYDNQRERIIQLREAKAETNDTIRHMNNMALYYLLTGDEVVGEEVHRRAMICANLDPHGWTSERISNFANSSLIAAMAHAYDLCSDLFSAEEKEAVANAIAARMTVVYDSFRPGLEQRLYHAHGWQLIMTEFLMGAIAVQGSVAEADEWLEWALKLSVATYPWWGGEDGGSAEGASYNVMDARSSMELRDLIHAATGIEMSTNPWYRGNIYYSIYSHPPHHGRSQFCSHGGGPWSGGPARGASIVARYRAALLDDPFAATYAEAYEGDFTDHSDLRELLMWTAEPMPDERSLRELPDAAAFEDIGHAMMHSSIDRPDANIFFEFISSPYGSHGHSYNQQNCFNLAAFNEPIFIRSGYYLTFGDPHHAGWTMQTKAHNGILIDGTGQPNSEITAHGKLLRFDRGPEYAFAAGEAKWAYQDVDLDRFARNCLWLKPDLVFIYDQLKAPEEHTYQWLLHTEEQMDFDAEAGTVEAHTDRADCRVTFVTPDALEMSQTDEFSVPPEEWPGRFSDLRDQWHFTAEPPEASADQRFLVAMEVQPKDAGFAEEVSDISGEGWEGLRLRRGETDIFVGFSVEPLDLDGNGVPVAMTLGSAEVTAYAAAAEFRGDELVRLAVVQGR
ncbi:MAG: DUF4962 domain-containing protein [Armatimonadota bacterium]